MTEDRPLAAYDPDTTPDALGALGVGQTWAHPTDAPIAPTVAGETFIDGDGNTRHVSPREDGRPVGLKVGNTEEDDA